MAVDTNMTAPSQSYDISPDESGVELGANSPAQGQESASIRVFQPRIELLTLRELAMRPPPTWSIADVIPSNSLALLHGATGIGKTWVALSMCVSLASGRDWFGKRVQQAPVVYVCAEGSGWMLDRIRGLCADAAELDVVLDRVACVPHSVALADPAHVRALLDRIVGAKSSPEFVVFDTVARSMGGADENDTKDMSCAIEGCDAIRRELHATVLLVHHSARDKSRARGSSALEGAVDTEMHLKWSGGVLQLECTKQRGGVPFESLRLSRHVVELAPSDGFGAATSCQLEVATGSSNPRGRRDECKERILQVLSEFPEGQGLTSGELAARVGGDNGTYMRARSELCEDGKVRQVGNRRSPYCLADDSHQPPTPKTPGANAGAKDAPVPTTTPPPHRGAGSGANGRHEANASSTRLRCEALLSGGAPSSAAGTEGSQARGRTSGKK